MHGLGAVVDATNHVMCELGQPTHTYDRNVVGSLSVDRAGAVDSLTSLDGSIAPSGTSVSAQPCPCPCPTIRASLSPGSRVSRSQGPGRQGWWAVKPWISYKGVVPVICQLSTLDSWSPDVARRPEQGRLSAPLRTSSRSACLL
jgi:hypothetical protein